VKINVVAFYAMGSSTDHIILYPVF